MTQKDMLVRLDGGDVIRRPVASELRFTDASGAHVGEPICEPELREGEVLMQVMGDLIPRIIKVK